MGASTGQSYTHQQRRLLEILDGGRLHKSILEREMPTNGTGLSIVANNLWPTVLWLDDEAWIAPECAQEVHGLVLGWQR